MIPGLGCVVEDVGLGFLVALGGGQYDLLEPHLFEGCARDQLVELIDIGPVMVIVVTFQGLGRDMGLECRFGVRQVG